MTSEKSLRILHVRTVCGSGGGPDRTILNSCLHLNERGHSAETFYMLDHTSSHGLVELLKNSGITVNVAHENSPTLLRSLRKFYRVLKEGTFDIVHAHEYKSAVMTAMLKRFFSFSYVATAHGYNQTSRREVLYYWLDRWSYPKADAIVTPSKCLKPILIRNGVPEEKIHVIPNGIESLHFSDKERERNSGGRKLIYVGRLSPEKDVANLLEAVCLLHQRNYPFDLTIVGDGPERKKLEETAHRLKLGDKIRFTGFVDDVMSLLHQSDVFVNPSRTECMPNSILEAMCAGCAIVATNVGGVPEMIRDGVDGVLCPSGDSHLLADTIVRVLSDSTLAASLGASAHHRAKTELTFEKHIEKTLEVYRQLRK